MTQDELEEFMSLSEEYGTLSSIPSASDISMMDFEEEEDVGFTSNVVRKMGEAASELVGGFIGTAYDITDPIMEAIGGDYDFYTDEEGKTSFGWRTTEQQQEEGNTASTIESALKNLDLGSEERYSLERLKEDPSLANIVGFGVETTGVSLVHMAGMIANMPAYFTARENIMADERAANDGGRETTFADYVAVAPGNAVETLLDRFMFRRMTDTKAAAKALKDAGYGGLAKEVVKRIGQEAATEGLIQEPASYLATHVGTEKGVKSDELKDVMLGGGIGGAFGGAVIGGPAAAIQRGATKRAEEARVNAALDEADVAMAEAEAANAEATGEPTTVQEEVIPQPVDTPVVPQPTFTPEQLGEDVLGVEPVVEGDVKPKRRKRKVDTQGLPTTDALVEAGYTKNEEGFYIDSKGEVLSDVKQAKAATEEVVEKATEAKRKVKVTKAQTRASKAVEAAQTDPTNIEKKETANDAIAELETVENDIKIEKAKEVQTKAEQVVKDREASKIEDNAFVKVSTGKRVDEAIISSYDAENDTYTVQKLDKKGNDKGKPVVVESKKVRVQKDRATPITPVTPTEMTEGEIAIEKAFTPIKRTEEAVEDPVVAPKPITTTTPTPTIPKVSKFLSDRAGWVYDGDGVFTDEMGDVHTPTDSQVDKLLAVRGINFDGQPITEKRAAAPKPKKLSKEDKALAALVAKVDTLTVQAEETAAPIGTEVEGQAEVDVTEDIDTTSLEDIDSPFEDENDIIMSADEAVKELQNRMDKAQKLKGCINA